MPETVAIIDYGSGNLRSAAKAFERVAAERAGGQMAVVVTDRPELVATADRVVLPGVGAFADCMVGLSGIPGMRDALEQAVRARGMPFLGICVGMQLMAERGVEYGTHHGLGWLPGEVSRLAPDGPAPAGMPYKVPHMGWNDLAPTQDHPVLAGLPGGGHAYFVHSFSMHCAEPRHVLATVDYGGTIAAMVGRDNMVGTQFHPEKSQNLGLHLIANFLDWRP